MKLSLNNSFLLIFLVTLFSCNSKFDYSSVIHEGIGVDKYLIKNLKTKNIEDELGKSYDLINHNNYSVEILYNDYGISFYYLLSDTNRIFAIAFNQNYKGQTSKGFKIRKMNVDELVKIYGKPRWNRLDDTVYAHYDSLGIYFQINPIDKEPNEFKFYSDDDSTLFKKMDSYYERVYKNEKVSEISIGLPGTDF